MNNYRISLWGECHEIWLGRSSSSSLVPLSTLQVCKIRGARGKGGEEREEIRNWGQFVVAPKKKGRGKKWN